MFLPKHFVNFLCEHIIGLSFNNFGFEVGVTVS